mmetsp:Transcript_48371/g.77935  ORF Transcript_48371/g.77935 Transcript_48371/m.77935 type:complete len:113 (-) Transcript_48371:819-1157(-)
MNFRGPEGDDKYYFGYKESKMLPVFVNLFAAISYWAKISSHVNGDVGPAANVMTYRYLDYVLTCPLLTVDLMWNLNLPYKISMVQHGDSALFVCVAVHFVTSKTTAESHEKS